MPVLSGLRVTLTDGSVELVGSDLELTIRVHTPADGDGSGSAVVPARLFSEIVHKLEAGVVTVELGDDDARIEGGRFSTTLRTLAAADFPRLTEIDRPGGRGAGGRFAEPLRPGGPAAARDASPPPLT